MPITVASLGTKESAPPSTLLLSGPAPAAYRVVAVEAAAANGDNGGASYRDGRYSSLPEPGNSGDGGPGAGSSKGSRRGSSSRNSRRRAGLTGSSDRNGGSSSTKGEEAGSQGTQDLGGRQGGQARLTQAPPPQAAGLLGSSSRNTDVEFRPDSNPAANAPLASATPLFGSPAAGTVIPGRYVVFFHSNISSLNVGLNR